MGILRTVEWRLRCSVADADVRFREALTKLEMTPNGPPGAITASAKRAMLRNRWAAEVGVVLTPLPDGCSATCRVDMAGSKHFEVLGELADTLGDEIFDDRGVADAMDRLGKSSRVFGRKELRHLRNLLGASERVADLGVGEYGGKQGLVVITNERLFFFEKSLGSETVEQFPIDAISSISVRKKRTGETLDVSVAGTKAEISGMMHGQGDAVSRAFRSIKQGGLEAPQALAPERLAVAADDPIEQLERLAALRDKGIVSDEEFEAKKAELMHRM